MRYVHKDGGEETKSATARLVKKHRIFRYLVARGGTIAQGARAAHGCAAMGMGPICGDRAKKQPIAKGKKEKRGKTHVNRGWVLRGEAGVKTLEPSAERNRRAGGQAKRQ